MLTSANANAAVFSQAEVGDDVWGDDPTVHRLQELAAAVVGKEAAIFVPSGTMGNLSAVLAHCHERGSEVSGSYFRTYEMQMRQV